MWWRVERQEGKGKTSSGWPGKAWRREGGEVEEREIKWMERDDEGCERRGGGCFSGYKGLTQAVDLRSKVENRKRRARWKTCGVCGACGACSQCLSMLLARNKPSQTIQLPSSIHLIRGSGFHKLRRVFGCRPAQLRHWTNPCTKSTTEARSMALRRRLVLRAFSPPHRRYIHEAAPSPSWRSSVALDEYVPFLLLALACWQLI